MIPTGLLSLFFDLGFARVWQAVPRPLRKRVVRKLLTLPDRQRLASAEPPLLVCGFLSSVVGLGWSARGLLRAAARAGLDALPIDISSGFHARDLPGADVSPFKSNAEPATLLLNCNPHQFAYVLGLLPRSLSDRKYIIAHCAWELEKLPQDWLSALEFVDEVWVPSEFVLNAFAISGCPRPVRVIPYQLDRPCDFAVPRSRFGLPDAKFIICSSFSVNSGFDRKNPEGCIESFRRAFAPEEPAMLIVKVSAGKLNSRQQARLFSAMQGDSRIIIDERLLSDRDMYSFLGCCDAILSLHRSEGFGLVPAQAMLLGKPVIATGWSGNMDYMNAHNAELVAYQLVPVSDGDKIYDVPGARWAEPDLNAAAAALRRCFASEDHCARLGTKAREDMEEFFAKASADLCRIFRQWMEAPGIASVKKLRIRQTPSGADASLR